MPSTGYIKVTARDSYDNDCYFYQSGGLTLLPPSKQEANLKANTECSVNRIIAAATDTTPPEILE